MPNRVDELKTTVRDAVTELIALGLNPATLGLSGVVTTKAEVRGRHIVTAVLALSVAAIGVFGAVGLAVGIFFRALRFAAGW